MADSPRPHTEERRPQSHSASSVHSSSHLRAPDSLGRTPGTRPPRARVRSAERSVLCSRARGAGPLLGVSLCRRCSMIKPVAFGDAGSPRACEPLQGAKAHRQGQPPGGALAALLRAQLLFLPFALPSPPPLSLRQLLPSFHRLRTPVLRHLRAGGSQNAHTACEPARRKQLGPAGPATPVAASAECSSRGLTQQAASGNWRSLPRTGPSSLA